MTFKYCDSNNKPYILEITFHQDIIADHITENKILVQIDNNTLDIYNLVSIIRCDIGCIIFHMLQFAIMSNNLDQNWQLLRNSILCIYLWISYQY